MADALARRLEAIERWVGMRPDLEDLQQEIAQVRQVKDAAIEQDAEASAALRDKEKQLLLALAAREKQWKEAAASRMPVAVELDRLNAEPARLRTVLREHGIDPGGDTAQPPA